MPSNLLVKASEPDADGRIHRITPESAGWKHVGFEVYLMKPGAVLRRETGKDEACLTLISGKASAAAGGVDFGVIGQRMSPFERTPPYSVYVPPGDAFAVVAETDLELAVCRSPGAGKYPARLIPPGDVVRATRGKGHNVRYVQTVLGDDSDSESLLVVEVFTDEGNTSSYPSHKHDQNNPPSETQLVETYYHRLDPPQGWAVQRVYTDDRSLDECIPVYDRDVVLVPEGYHPVITVAGYDSYYLNVMAGPVKEWHFTEEKDHAWIRTDAYPRR